MKDTSVERDKQPASVARAHEVSDAKLAAYLWQTYDLLDGYFGNLHWWPADSAFEMAVGSILTQNTAWRNVCLAITKLKEAGIVAPSDLEEVETERLEILIRSSGYYHVKARRLKAFSAFLQAEYDGSMTSFAAGTVNILRKKLLHVDGIGAETADSILLYACQKPIFVVDTYTKRILSRHAVVAETANYDTVQDKFMSNLPVSVPLYNQYHALLVHTGKQFCSTTKRCEGCPLGTLPTYTD
ncbi:MAG: endonuclease III domain-containing protein [Syntrophales bacterium LBB04]|nr:endonuclease III domain-containing protein [Syntrophales bacterium LBB04]